MATMTYSNPGWTNGGPPALNKANLDLLSNALASIGSGGTSSAVAADGLATTAGIVPASQLVAFRNKLINGRLDIWQRGTSILLTAAGTAGAFLADRWYGAIGGTGGSTTYSQQPFAAGQTAVPGNPNFFARMLCTNGGDATNGFHRFQQAIENVALLSGKTMTLSLWIKSDANQKIALSITQAFGTGGSANADTYVSQITTTTGWALYTFTFTVPSISGKTLGSDSTYNSATVIRLWMSAGSTYASQTGTLGIQTGTFDFAMLQCEIGSVATDFEQRPIGTELALCQRYYEKSFAQGTAPAQSAGTVGVAMFPAINVGAATNNMGTIKFAVTKRILPPTITTYNPSAANAQVRDANAGADCSSTTQWYATDASFALSAVGNAGTAAGNKLIVHWTADAEL